MDLRLDNHQRKHGNRSRKWLITFYLYTGRTLRAQEIEWGYKILKTTASSKAQPPKQVPEPQTVPPSEVLTDLSLLET